VSGQRHAPAALLPPGKGPPVPIVQENGWAPEPVWTQRLEEKLFRLCRRSNPDRPVVQSVSRHYTDWATRLKKMRVYILPEFYPTLNCDLNKFRPSGNLCTYNGVWFVMEWLYICVMTDHYNFYHGNAVKGLFWPCMLHDSASSIYLNSSHGPHYLLSVYISEVFKLWGAPPRGRCLSSVGGRVVRMRGMFILR
jgi:hypothetical protein